MRVGVCVPDVREDAMYRTSPVVGGTLSRVLSIVSVPQSLKEPRHRPEDPEAHRRGTNSHTGMRREPHSGEGSHQTAADPNVSPSSSIQLHCHFFASDLISPQFHNIQPVFVSHDLYGLFCHVHHKNVQCVGRKS